MLLERLSLFEYSSPLPSDKTKCAFYEEGRDIPQQKKRKKTESDGIKH